MPRLTNAARAERIEMIAEDSTTISGTSREDIATDLLADIFHWCVLHDISVDEVLVRAKMHFAAERDEETRPH